MGRPATSVFVSLWLYRYLPRAVRDRLAARGWLVEPEEMERIGGGTLLPESAPLESYLSFQQFLDSGAKSVVH